jgi:hypothetical protein
MDAPNAVWTNDYKGQFKLGDGQYCFPLTVADGCSRMLLGCQALTSTKLVEARPVFERLFRAYGLPQRIRSDNGVPFATQALGSVPGRPDTAAASNNAASIAGATSTTPSGPTRPSTMRPRPRSTPRPQGPILPASPRWSIPVHYEIRRVSRNGGIRWHKQWVNVSQTLGEEYVGLVEVDDGEWDVYFGPLRLDRFHEPTLRLEDALGRQYRRRY